jgi:Putative amidoligase enzyme
MNSPVDATLLAPPTILQAEGGDRRVGVEVEFLGPSARTAATALARDLGGTVEAEDPHAFRVLGTRLGTIAIEADLRYVHPARHPDLGVRLGSRGSALLGALSSPIVPRELVTAPLPVWQLASVDEAVASLRSAGARGRGAVLLASLGLHFNIDLPSLDASTLTAYLKAFLTLSDRLRQQVARGSLRLALTLPPEFPESYRTLVLAPDYWPSLADLTADYLAANPTRKRALDLLPVLAHLREHQVRETLPREKIGPRPALHYRLPHAHVGEPGWSILPDWYDWLAVERLAAELIEKAPRSQPPQMAAR